MWLKRKCHFLVLVFILLNSSSILADNANIRICGFTQNCKGNWTYNKLKANPCCIPCECTDVCKERNTCCHDKEGRNDTKNVIKQECIPALYVADERKEIDSGMLFYVRTKCPTTYKNENIKNKCENNAPKLLKEVAFVSSKDGKIVYKNEFCALCYGETDTKIWQVHGVKYDGCFLKMMKRNFNTSSLTETILTKCTLLFGRPKHVDLQNVMCVKEDEVINKCNTTGKMEMGMYNNDITEFCENTPGKHTIMYIR